MAAGDVVVAATDGVWDNVFPEELAGVVDAAQRRGETPAAAAATVAQLALSRRALAPSPLLQVALWPVKTYEHAASPL